MGSLLLALTSRMLWTTITSTGSLGQLTSVTDFKDVVDYDHKTQAALDHLLLSLTSRMFWTTITNTGSLGLLSSVTDFKDVVDYDHEHRQPRAAYFCH